MRRDFVRAGKGYPELTSWALKWLGRLAMMMFSIFATLLLWKINPRTWLSWYFEACAANTGQTPKDFENFLPWNVGDDRLKELRSPTLPVPADSS